MSSTCHLSLMTTGYKNYHQPQLSEGQITGCQFRQITKLTKWKIVKFVKNRVKICLISTKSKQDHGP